MKLEDHDEGIVIPLRITPGSSRDRILGEHAGALKVAVSAPPEKGKANKSVCSFLAGKLEIAKTRLSVIAGESSRDKKLLVRGVTADYVRNRLFP